jgi:hypothetical protein
LIKTHFPYIYPHTYPLSGSTAIVLARNPLDMIVSLFMMSLTLTHSKSCSNDFTKEFAEEWNWAVTQYMNLWNEFYKYWIDLAKNKTLPVIFIRFEDLL